MNMESDIAKNGFTKIVNEEKIHSLPVNWYSSNIYE